MPARPGFFACINRLEEADRIEACIDSLAFCDEGVVDSGPVDNTPAASALA